MHILHILDVNIAVQLCAAGSYHMVDASAPGKGGVGSTAIPIEKRTPAISSRQGFFRFRTRSGRPAAYIFAPPAICCGGSDAFASKWGKHDAVMRRSRLEPACTYPVHQRISGGNHIAGTVRGRSRIPDFRITGRDRPADRDCILRKCPGSGRELVPWHVRRPLHTKNLVSGAPGNAGKGRGPISQIWPLFAFCSSWAPFIGDPITVVAGLLREPLWSFLLLVTIAKSSRYIVVAMLVSGVT